MSGIYIHIPFCKQACHYCNFHFSTSLQRKDDFVKALCKEIEIRKNYLTNTNVSSIYFGGGTPSLLSEEDMARIFGTLSKYFSWSSAAEITLEANPDDISLASLDVFAQYGVNRLSVGIQSFFDEDLQFMNRAHSANEAIKCLQMCQDKGFDNLSIDLIYGSNTTTNDMWMENINKALALDVPHISSYCLTVEDKTALEHQIRTNKLLPPDPQKASDQFGYLMATLGASGYDHYEISNFAKPNQYAVHNTNYWKGVPYIGFGPSAHSFDQESRSWNVANNNKYIAGIIGGTEVSDKEILDTNTRYNEYIMTGLRTMWGVHVETIKSFGNKYMYYFNAAIADEIKQGMVVEQDDYFVLTNEGKHFADRIAMHLFFVE